mgnify:CR=1 FL=1
MILHIIGYEDVPFRVNVTPLTQGIVSALLTEFGNVGVVGTKKERENIRYVQRDDNGYSIHETAGMYVLEQFKNKKPAVRRFLESVK